MSQVSYGTITITDTNDIESIIIEYARNQSTSDAPSSGWSTSRPAWAQGYYIWQRARIHKSGTETSADTFGTAVCITGSTGQTGTSVTISSIKYAVSTTESQPADSSFTYTSVPTVAEGSWLWTLTTYSNGSKVYTKSKQGISGDSITISKVEYQSGTSPTTAPTGTWQSSVPSVAEGNYLWTKTTYSDGNYTYSVAKQGVSGTSVSISSTSVKYQVSTSGTTTPTGEWKDTVQSTTVGQYLWTRTIVTYSNGSSTTSYSVAAHGANGTSVSISSIKYAVSNTDSQPADSSFTSTTVPFLSDGQWLWTLTTYSNGSKMYTKSKQGDDGRSLTNTVTKYTHVASGTTQSQVENLAENNWTDNVPTYNSSLPDYWVRITNTYDKAPLTERIYYKDNGITDSIAKANEAWNKADQAQSDASDALGAAQAATAATALLGGHFIYNSEWQTTNTPHSANVVQTVLKNGVDVTTDPTKWDYNVHIGANGIRLRNNESILSEWTSTALKFNNPSNGNAQLIIGANGTLQSGNYTRGSDSKFSSNGTKIDLINGDIITKYFRVSQGLESGLNAGVYVHGTIEALDGTIGTDSTNYWEIGNGTDYNLNSTAKMIGHGSSYIQLGDSSTWRLATNRIHTGWYTSNDSLLHFPTISSKYWDFGIHVPDSGNDKFLYVRSSKANTSASNALQNLLYDIDDTYATAQWDYLFYIDGAGNVHAPAYYVGSEPLTGGVGSIAEKIINSDSTYGKGSTTQPIYIDSNGRPATTTYALNAAGAKGVDTSIAAASTSTNLPTSKAVAAFVEGKGYITSYTDYRVKTEARGSTTMYLAGSNTSGTVSQGTLLTDSGVYIQTSSSSTNLVVPKVNGYTLAAASAKGVDTSIADASTSTNLPTSKAVAAFVEGKGYKTTDNNTTYSLTQDSNDGHKITLTPSSGNAQTIIIPDNNTTYTFTNGTNGFTVTPSGGEAQTVTVTPSISNNITGTGTRTSGYLAKFSGTNTITNGPALGTDTTKFLNNKGEWAVPAGTYTYTLPLAANGTRGGVQIGYTQSGKNYPVQLSSEKMYVNVPWENTTYSAGTGLSLSGTTFNHSNSVTAGTAGTSSATSSTNRTIDIPYVTYDEQGHITGSGTHTHTLSSFPEAYLSWGGRNFSASYGCIDAAMIDVLGANRFAFLKAAGLTIEYSTDGGSNWTDYGATNVQKTGLFGAGQNFYLGKATAKANNTVNNQLRVTIDTGAASIYTVLNKIAIYMSTAGNTVQVLIEKALQSTPTTYSTHLNWTGISGWSGWNILNISELTTYGNTAASQYGRVRFTFKQAAINSNYPSANISRIMGFGGVGWTVPSNMARDGHLYSYDNSQNATFPAQITATQFNGTLSGNVSGTATGNVTSVQYDSTNTKFTYTKNDTNTDIVTIANLKTYLGLGSLAYKSSLSKSDVGLGNVDNLSAASIRSGISSSNVTNALGYTPSKTISSIGISGSTITITYSDSTTTTGTMTAAVAEVATQATKLTDANGNAITVGSTSQPVYFSSGVPVGISGTNGAALVGKGANQAPEWKALGSAAYSNTTAFATSAQGTKADSAVQSISFSGTALTISSGAASITQANARTALGLAAAAYKALADSSSASAIGTGTNVTTERDVYYGLPTINNAHNYTSSTTIYAPTAGGTSSQVLIGNGTTSAPVWTDISGIVPSSATNATNATYATYDASEVDNSTKVTIANKYIPKSIGTAAGDIIYWSASGTPTRLAKGSNGQVLKLANGVPTWGSDNNTWDALSTSQAGYVAKAPNDTAKFLRGDASWAAVTKSNVGLGNVDNTADANKRVKGANITTTANAVAYYTDAVGTFGSKASANGALYATSANGALNWGTLPIAQGGTGKTTALAAITNLGGPYILAGGTEITASSNLDTDYTAAGTYYSSNSTRSASLSGTVVSTDSGFKMITMKGYRDQNILQFANWNDERLLYRYSNAATVSFGKWYQLVRLPSGSDNKTFAAIGGSTQPVYVNSSGVVTACTSYANATVGKSNKTGAADLTTTANAIAYYTDTAGTFGSKASANGALYATSANGALNWGTLPVAQGGTGLTASPSMLTNLGSTTAANVLQASPRPGITGTLGVANGGTGATSFTANSVIISGSTTTAALTTRAITNVTSGAVTANTNLVTANSLVAHVANKIAAASDTYVTIATDQTITASQKTFNGAIRWGTTSKYGAAHYDSTLEAIVFSFA